MGQPVKWTIYDVIANNETKPTRVTENEVNYPLSELAGRLVGLCLLDVFVDPSSVGQTLQNDFRS